jgi:hypothetical protein
VPTDDKGGIYPALTDAPNGPAALLALLNSIAQSEIGAATNPGAVTINTSGTTTIATKVVPVRAGRLYVVMGYFDATATASGTGAVQLFGPGGMLPSYVFSGSFVSSGIVFGNGFSLYTAPSDTNAQFSIAGQTNTGVFQVGIGKSNLLVADLGLLI